MNKKAGVYNLFAVAIKILAGPFVYYLISLKFDASLLLAYFFILTINNLRTIFEGGVTNIIKRKYISSKEIEFSKINTFSLYWFSITGILLFFVSILIGSLYLHYVLKDFSMVLFPLVLASFASSLRIILLFVDAYIDSVVSSSAYRKIILLSNIVSLSVLIVSIELNFNLYSIFLSQMSQVIIVFFFTKKYFHTFQVCEKNRFKIFKLKYYEFKGLITPTMKTWTVGYLFWNSTVLITPGFFDKEFSSRIIFTYSVFKSIYDVAASVFIANIPSITFTISQHIKKNIRIMLMRMLAVGSILYIVCLVFLMIIIHLNIVEMLNNKFLDSSNLFFIAVLFYIILTKTIVHNFVRCYQIEPFFYFVLYNAVIMTLSPLLSYYYKLPFFLPHCLFLLPMLYFSSRVLKSRLN